MRSFLFLTAGVATAATTEEIADRLDEEVAELEQLHAERAIHRSTLRRAHRLMIMQQEELIHSLAHALNNPEAVQSVEGVLQELEANPRFGQLFVQRVANEVLRLRGLDEPDRPNKRVRFLE